jgi:hypothetical protein
MRMKRTSLRKSMCQQQRWFSDREFKPGLRTHVSGLLGLGLDSPLTCALSAMGALTSSVVASASYVGGMLGPNDVSAVTLGALVAFAGCSATGTWAWVRVVRHRVALTPEVGQALLRLRELADETEALEPVDAREDLLAALAAAATSLASVGPSLKAAGPGSASEVSAHHEAAAAVVAELEAALADLVSAQAARREAFALRSDLSEAAGTMAALKALSAGTREAAAAAKAVESAAVEEIRAVSGTRVRASAGPDRSGSLTA